MIIKAFNTKKGVYQFELPKLETLLHTHPAVEIIYAPSGNLAIETLNSFHQNIHFAVIDANIKHKVTSEGECNIIMLECHPDYLLNCLSSLKINLEAGIYIEQAATNHFFQLGAVFRNYSKVTTTITNQERIQICLDYLDSSTSEYKDMMIALQSRVFLSDSRISHLFKAEIGISIKKYLVWSKLKRSFEKVLTENKSMYEAALETGFYDQAHLSKAFKQMFGIRPSTTYNSRMLQI